MVEIYNETIHDLLSSKLPSLEIRAQGAKITLAGMTELPVETARDIDEIIKLGEKNRTVASTKMNSQRYLFRQLHVSHLASHKADTPGYELPVVVG